MDREFALIVNGETVSVRAPADTSLLVVLRNDLGLTATKYGCGIGQCGACTVIVDKAAEQACAITIADVAGKTITTLEGLGGGHALDPLQRAFLDLDAAQCGYCTAGFIMRARALLDTEPSPSDDAVRIALDGNLCRCGTYGRVLRAVRLCRDRDGDGANGRLRRSWSVRRHPGDAPENDTPSPSLAAAPSIDAWIRIEADETVTVRSGKVELGQGIRTALAQIAADELDIRTDRVRVPSPDTDNSPDEGYTAGSASVEVSGGAVRRAAAAARHRLLTRAAADFGVPIERLSVDDGTVRDAGSNRRTNYWELAAGRLLDADVVEAGTPKSGASSTLTGTPVPRLDLPRKVTGAPSFVHDLRIEGMLYGRIVRPPTPGATLASAPEGGAEASAGIVAIVRDGNFLGVVAEREDQAEGATARLRARAIWKPGPDLPHRESVATRMMADDTRASSIVDGTPAGAATEARASPATAALTLDATYTRPFQMHASLGPSAAVAVHENDRLTVWTASQGIFPLRAELARVLGMAEDEIHVIHADGAGCYGHNGADDAALDAALLACAVPGRPVKLQWTRADENAYEPYATPMAVRMRGSLDGGGRVVDWNHEVWTGPHVIRPLRTGKHARLIAAREIAREIPIAPPEAATDHHGGGQRNAEPLYRFPKTRIAKHFVADVGLPTSSFRGLGAFANVFAIESFMDELAVAAGADPVEFRLRHLQDSRARAVIEVVAEACGWGSPGIEGVGRGIAFARYKNAKCYAAVVVETRVDPDTFAIGLSRAWIAADAGRIVNPDGLANQLEGGLVFAASQTLKEEVDFEKTAIVSLDWESYPILKMSDAPDIETVLIDRAGAPSLGAGEAVQGPTPAAIANGVFHAIGVRLRDIPFTPARVRDACLGT